MNTFIRQQGRAIDREYRDRLYKLQTRMHISVKFQTNCLNCRVCRHKNTVHTVINIVN